MDISSEAIDASLKVLRESFDLLEWAPVEQYVWKGQTDIERNLGIVRLKAADKRAAARVRLMIEDSIRAALPYLFLPYDREILVEILVYHYRNENSSCGCGWAELGKSHPEHVANVYEESIKVRSE